MPQNLQELIKKVAQTEATPALIEFWEKQYSQALTSRFRFDPETNTGFINLVNLLTQDKKDIDHQELQQTISVGVRFLDGLTNELDFREIRLSVDNFDEFLKTTDTASQIGIDYIGSLVSDFSYRASENLAHEKGAFLQFDKIPKHLRNVEFEMWVDKEDNYKNGQELATLFDDTTIISSPWSLVPRRNFAILDFTNDNPYWDKWNDIYHKTEPSTPTQVDTTTDLPKTDLLNDVTNESKLDDFSFDLDDDEQQDFSTDFENTTPEKNEVIPNETIKPKPENQPSQTIEEKAILEPASHPIMNENFFEKSKTEVTEASNIESQEFDFNDLVEPAMVPEIESEKEEIATELNHEESNQNLEDLKSNSTHEDLAPFHDDALQPGIDYTETGAAALVMNDQNQVLLIQKQTESATEWTLPSVNITLNQIPEEAILKYLQTNTASNSRILDEVGSVMLSQNPSISHSLNIIYNVFFIALNTDLNDLNSKITSPQIISFEYFNLDQLPQTSILVKVAIDKHFRRQKQLQDFYEHKLTEWEAQMKPQLETEIRTELEAEMASVNQKNILPVSNEHHLSEEINDIDIDVENEIGNDLYAEDFDEKTEHETQPVQSPLLQKSEEMDQVITHVVKHPNLAKFKVKLEQWIESDKFGGLGLALGYSSKGLESITLLESELNQELKSSLDLILHLFNHLLSHGLDLKTLVSGLNLQYGNNEIKINQILSLILENVLSAPDKISKISDDLLI